MADVKLSVGTLSQAMREENPVEPVWQILNMKKVAGQGGQERYRMQISDGECTYSFAMLATQLNNMVHEKLLDAFTVIKVDRFTCNTMNGRRIIILLQLSVVAPASEVGVKIGNPVAWNENAPNPAAATARPAEPSYQQPRQQNGNSFGAQPKVEPKSQNAFSSNASSVLPADVESSVVPIRDVNPYTGKVSIRARVTSKGDIKTWSNSKGEGKLFSMDLLDDSGEIRMTGFNTAVDSFYDLIQVNNVYYINKFSVKPANKSFNSTNHEYEISFIPDTAVYPCLQDTSDIPTLQFNFCKIADIENMAVDSLVDIIGVVKTYGDLQTFTAKTSGKELKKRELTIVDTSCKEIALTLWGKAAESFNDDSQPVVAVKGAKVGEYQGKNLSLLGSSTFQINPDLPECHQLRGWFDNEGANATTQSLSTGGGKGNSGSAPWKLLSEANEVTTTDMEKGDYFMSKVSLMAIKRDNAMYMACETPNCNKKVIDQGNGTYRCEKCQKDMPGYKWRLMVTCNFADFTDQVWATAFHEAAEKIFGKSGEELGEMYKDRSAEFDELVKEIAFQDFIVKFRSRMEMYNNETRKKFTVLELHKINHAEYAKQLLAEIQESGN